MQWSSLSNRIKSYHEQVPEKHICGMKGGCLGTFFRTCYEIILVQFELGVPDVHQAVESHKKSSHKKVPSGRLFRQRRCPTLTMNMKWVVAKTLSSRKVPRGAPESCIGRHSPIS